MPQPAARERAVAANAKLMRLLAVTDAIPQKYCATIAMNMSSLAAADPSAVSMSRGAAFTRKLSPAPPNAMAPYASASIPPSRPSGGPG